MTDREFWLGEPFPLGATFDGHGTNFALFSESASKVELCLFDDHGNEERVTLPEERAHVHHGYLPSVRPGQAYGYRVSGEWDPANGKRSNPQKLLIDPYAKAVSGGVNWSGAVFGHDVANPGRMNMTDSAPDVPRSIVVDDTFNWGSDVHPRTPWHETCIYEAHVRGLTKTHPEVPAELRGTYTGLAHPAMVDYLVDLGVTAVELMPIHQFIPEGFIVERGLTNYWGYQSAAFFAPHAAYASAGDQGQQVAEFKEMVKALHSAGLEVLLDVVYNHTCEGTADGPTLSMRGIDNEAYYRLDDADRGRYVDFTGTGNTLNVRHPATLHLVMDSLRYWVQEMHVDGFRFDLASALAREFYDVDRLAAFFDLIHQDPVINRTKLIAEPWDVGPGGYQVGNFPALWSEWNAHYRDDVRDFWRGNNGTVADFAYRFTGSSDLYDSGGRTPFASINFVTAHDGYSLRDLVSYEQRHNQLNGEDNRDGHHDNRSWNGGVEGPTTDPQVETNRRRRASAMMATLLFSQGVPMISGGDEIGRTQRGNNNAWSQDNETSWHDWENVDADMLDFTKFALQLRRNHPTFRRRHFFEGEPVLGSTLDDIGWFTPAGTAMSDGDWHRSANALAVFLNGNTIGNRGPKLQPVVDDSFLFFLNGTAEPLSFTVPEGLGGERWRVVLHTDDPADHDVEIATRDEWKVPPWTMVLLQRENARV